MVRRFLKTYRPVIVLTVVAALAEAAYAAINMLALQVFIYEVLNLTAYLGIIYSTFLIVEAVMKSVMGTLADRYGGWKFLGAAPLVSGCTALLMVALGSAVHRGGGASGPVEYSSLLALLAVLVPLLFNRAIDGVAAAAFWPTMFATIYDNAPEHRRTSSMSFITVAYMVGVALGVPLAGWANEKSPLARRGTPTVTQVYLLDRSDDGPRGGFFREGAVETINQQERTLVVGGQRFWINKNAKVLVGNKEETFTAIRLGERVGIQGGNKAAAFLVVGALFFVTACVSFLLVPRRRPARRRKAEEGAGDGHDKPLSFADLTIAWRMAPSLVLTAAVVFVAVGSLGAIAKLYAQEVFYVSDWEFSRMVVVPGIIIGVLTLPVGMLGDRWGHSRSVHVGIGMAFFALFCMAAVAILEPLRPLRTENVVAALATLLGLGFVMGLPAWLQTVAEIAGEERRAQMIGAVATSEGLGAFIGAMLGPFFFAQKDTIPFMLHAPMVLAVISLGIGFAIALITIRPQPRPPGPPPAVPSTTDELAELIAGMPLPHEEPEPAVTESDTPASTPETEPESPAAEQPRP